MEEINTIFSKGKDSLQPAIFIHGDLQNHTSLNFIAKLMQSLGHSTLEFDLPGHGLSKLPEKDLITILKSIIEKNQISKPIIIAHSFGTSLASEYAKTNDTSSLILINPLLSNPATVNPALDMDKMEEEYTKYSKAIFKEQKLINYSDKTKNLEEFQKLGLETTDTKGMINNINFMKSLPTEDSIQNIEIPILLIASKEDKLIPTSYAKQLQQKAKSAKLEIIEGEHNAILTNPQNIINAINKNYKFLLSQ